MERAPSISQGPQKRKMEVELPPPPQKQSKSQTISIMCWNIRHLRKEKVESFGEHIMHTCLSAEICFLLENKTKPNETAIALRKAADAFLTSIKETGAYECDAFPYGNGSTETIVVLYQKHPDKQTRIAVRLDGARNNYPKKIQGFRYPLVFDVAIERENARRALSVAVWHAPGPSKQDTTLRVLDDFMATGSKGIDLFLGDFNFTGSPTQHHGTASVGPMLTRHAKETGKKPPTKEQLQDVEQTWSGFSEIGPTVGVSTYNDTGLTTNRQAPLDRCFVGKSLLGRAKCELVDVDQDFEIGFSLTDHWAQRVDITL